MLFLNITTKSAPESIILLKTIGLRRKWGFSTPFFMTTKTVNIITCIIVNKWHGMQLQNSTHEQRDIMTCDIFMVYQTFIWTRQQLANYNARNRPGRYCTFFPKPFPCLAVNVITRIIVDKLHGMQLHNSAHEQRYILACDICMVYHTFIWTRQQLANYNARMGQIGNTLSFPNPSHVLL